MDKKTNLETTAELDISERDLDRQRQAQRWRYILRDKKALFGLVTLTVLVLAAVLAPIPPPYDPNLRDDELIGEPTWAPPRAPVLDFRGPCPVTGLSTAAPGGFFRSENRTASAAIF